MIKNQKAQGDVLFTQIENLPNGAKLEKTRTVAYGEATGHHHTMTNGQVYTIEEMMFVVVPDGAEVKHQEHAPVWLEPGIYQVDHQIEVDPFTGIERRVSD